MANSSDGQCLETQVTYADVHPVEPNEFLGGWFDMTKGFVYAVMSEPSLDLLKDVVNKGYVDDYVELLRNEAPFLACVVMGLVFMVGIAISGLIVCCCRCCCKNCGGSKYQRDAKHVRCRRQSYTVALFLFLVCISIGVACSFLSIGRGVKTSQDADKIVLGVLGNARLFVSKTVQDAKCLIQTEALYTIDRTIERIEDVGNDGKRLEIKMAKILDDMELESKCVEIDNKTVVLLNSFDEFYKGLGEFEADSRQLKSESDQQKAKVDSFKTHCGNTCLKLDSSLLDLTVPGGVNQAAVTTENDRLEKVIRSDPLLDEYEKVMVKINDISKTVVTKTQQIREDAIKDLDKFKKTLTDDSKDGFLATADKILKDVDKMYKDTEDILNHDYDKQTGLKASQIVERVLAYASIVAMVLILIPTAFWFFGLICGIMGDSEDQYSKPTRRGCLSNCGGVLMIIGCYLFFFLSIFVMLATMTLFLIGGHLQVYICQPLYEDTFVSLDKFYNMTSPQIESNNFTKEFLPSNLLSDCKARKPIIQALGMQEYAKEQLDKYLDFEKDITVEKDLDKVDFDTKNLLEKFIDYQSKVDVFKFTETEGVLLKLNSANPKPKLEALISQAEKLLPNLSDDKKTELQNIIDGLKNFFLDIKESEWLKALSSGKSSMDSFADVKTNFRSLDFNNASAEIEEAAKLAKKRYIDEVLSPGRAYVERAKNKILTDFAKCWVLWDTFDVGRNVLCKGFLDPLNGYWYGLGWCIFFQLWALVCAFKLSKHYYRMDRQDTEDGEYTGYEFYDGAGSKETISAVPLHERRGYNEYGYGNGNGHPPANNRNGYPPPNDRSYANQGFREYN